jgi:SulP family sulfate permease
MIRLGSLLRRESLRHDGVAGVVLGVESVPDGLAGGLLAGVNPVYGLYAYLVGTFTGALVTSSSFMAVQATSAMAIVVADVDTISDADDPARALFTLSIITGVLMILAGVARLGSLLRFVSNADAVRTDDIYAGDEWVGRTVRQAHHDALDWIHAHRQT